MTRLSSHLAWILPLAAAVVSAGFLAANDSLFHLGDWVALAVLGIAFSVLGGRAFPRVERWLARHRTSRKTLAAAGPYALSFVLVAIALWPVPWELPVSQDHAHHYLNTAIQLDLITSGHIFGWTDRVSTGLPFGDVYGTPAYIATALVRIVTLGLVSLEASYSIGVFGIWLAAAWAIVAFVRRLVPQSLWAAPGLATAAFVFDPGADREGGWVYSMFHAVWPQLFATAIFCWALIALFRLAEKPTYRRLGVAVLVTGFAFWMHPMNALNLLVLSPIIIGLWLFGEEAEFRTSGHWLIVAFAAAAIIGWAWLSHIYTGSDAMAGFAAYGIPLDQMGEQAWTGLFENAFAGWGLLGLIGLVTAVGIRERFSAVVVACLVAYIVLGSMTLLLGFDLGISEHNSDFMWRRFYITAKPFWFALVGVGAAVIARGLRSTLRESLGDLDPRITWALATPLVFAIIGAAYLWIPGPAARPLTAEANGIDEHIDTIADFLEAETNPDQVGPLRLAARHDRGDHGDYMLFAIADAGWGHVPNRTPPCQAFADLWAPKSISMARFAGSTHVLTREKKSIKGAKLAGESAQYHLYRFEKDDPDALARIRGKGTATVESWQPMRREIHIEAVDEKSRLELAFPPYKKWHATLGDKPIELGKTKRGGEVLVEVKDLAEGTLVIEFEDTWLERISFFFALLVALLAIFALYSGRRLPPLFGSWGARTQHAVAVVIAAGAGAVFTFFVSVEDEAQTQLWLAGEKHPVDLLEVLHHDEPEVFTYDPDPFCVRPYSRRPRPGCHEAVLAPRLRPASRRGDHFPSCMQIGVPDNGSATIGWSTEEPARLKARIHMDRSLSATLHAGDKKVKIRDGKVFKHPVDGEFRIAFENRGGSEYPCIEAALLSAE